MEMAVAKKRWTRAEAGLATKMRTFLEKKYAKALAKAWSRAGPGSRLLSD